MNDLINFIIKGITGVKDIKITEEVENDHTTFNVQAPKEAIGIIIGKGGRTIKAIRNLLKVRATLEKKGVSISIVEEA